MQRPVMNPTFEKVEAPVAARKSKWRAAWRAVLAVGRVLLSDPLRRRQRVRIEDGKPLQRFMRGLAYRLALLPVLLVGFLILLVLAATHPGRAAVGADPLAFGVYYDPVSFLSEDGVRLEGWLAPAVDARRVLADKEATLQRKFPAVILVHDFAGSRQQLLPLVRPLHDAGMIVLVLRLRGSNSLTGEAQTFGLNEAMDVRAAVEMLKRRPFVDENKIAAVGVGTGANATLLAARRGSNVAAFVLSNPIDGFDEAFARRVGPNNTWLPPLRALFRWTFQVMYRVDADDLELDSYKELLASRPVLRMDANRDLMQPSAMRDIGQFLAHHLAGETVAGAK